MRRFLPFLLVAITWLSPARADEPGTLFGNTVDGWRSVLRDKASTEVARRRAIWTLGAFGPEAKASEPELVQEVREGKLAREAAGALARIGVGAPVTVPFLINEFVKEGCIHLTGAGTFIGFGANARNDLTRIAGPAVPPLVDLLKGPNTEMRVCAADALGWIGPAARPAVPWLIRAIEHPDDNPHAEILRRYAVRALGQIGPEAKEAVPVLSALLEKEELVSVHFTACAVK